MRYEVTAYYSEVVEVEAENENEAISKAQEQLKNINVALIADNFEAVEIED
ncbi:MAG: hypothetical protein E7290_02090 [Lachnospiraceae bacterium]|nr:hypothetical protein [Lachnospiraceae bacterium]